VLPGGHDGDYWTRNLPLYLHYYDHMLRGATSPTVRLALATRSTDDPVLSAPDDPALALPAADGVLAAPDDPLVTLPDLDSPTLSAPDAPLASPDDGPDLDPADLPADLLPTDDPDWTPDGGAVGPVLLSVGLATPGAS